MDYPTFSKDSSTSQSFTKDIAQMRAFLRIHGLEEILRKLKKPSLLIAFAVILIDWTVIFLAVGLTIYNILFFPVSLLIIGSRQRALMILLHEASHYLLASDRQANDGLAKIFICPPLLKNLANYRKGHNDHHKYLGHPEKDGDFLHDPDGLKAGWQAFYFQHVFARRTSIVKSTVNNLNRLNTQEFKKLIAWWCIFLGFIALIVGVKYAIAFILLWGMARVTTYHLLNTFAMLSDHVGLFPGSILGFTRNHPADSLLSWLFHPHASGYHITHHLAPNIPFYRLGKVHNLLKKWDRYEKAEHCRSYFLGKGKVTDSWMKCTL